MKKNMTLKQFLFILPLMILLFVFSIYPIVSSLFYTLFDYRTNNQQYNSFYMTNYLNQSLFYEDCDYILFFLTDELAVATDTSGFEEVYAEVESMMSNYEEKGENIKLGNDRAEEITEFIDNIEQQLNEAYAANEGVEFYNQEKVPMIIEEMRSCLIESNFSGGTNFVNLIRDSRFWRDTLHTVLFTVCSVTIEFVLGMLLALIMDKAMRGIGIIRTIGLIPWAIPTAVSAMMWSYLYDSNSGIVSHVFTVLGLLGAPEEMLLTSSGAMVAALIADIWKTTPYMALLLLAGLQVIDRGLYESASIDGATPIKTFFKITLPLMKPSIMVALLFRTLDAFRVYDLIAILTSGGPGGGTETLSVYAYKVMFEQGRYGYGSAVVVGMFVFVAVIAFVYVKILGADVLGDE